MKKKTSSNKKGISYFQAIVERVAEIEVLANAYVETLPEDLRNLSAEECAERIWDKTFERWDWHTCLNKDSDAPEFVKYMADNGTVPYCFPPRQGSLYQTLAYSVTSAEAHRLHLLEIVEGRLPVDSELPFPVLAEKSVVHARCGIKEEKPKSRRKPANGND